MMNNLRRHVLLLFVLLAAVRMFGDGFIATEGGLVVDLKPGDRILLSTMVNGKEYFVCHHPGYSGGDFNQTNYDDGAKGNILKLIPQDAGATEPGAPSIWTIDEAVPLRFNGVDYTLDGIAYTMWSSYIDNEGKGPYTLVAAPSTVFRTQGHLTRDKNHNNICNVIFVAPTNRSSVTSFDPNRTLAAAGVVANEDQDAQGRINGGKGYGFLGLPYREVYWLDIPRGNSNPTAYSNASLIGFNTFRPTGYSYSNGQASALYGQAYYAFAGDNKHNTTRRTIFRLYVLDQPVVSSCPDSYFFAYDEQDFVNYTKDFSKSLTTKRYPAPRKTYTIDYLKCMEQLGETNYYLTDYMYVPEPDSTYFYVGYQNKYCHSPSTGGTDAFDSQFKNIDSLKIHYLGLKAPRGAYGQMMVDITKTDQQNLGVEFQPGGYFLRTSTGRNIQLTPSTDYKTWTCEEMWHITEGWAALTIKATMFTGSEFSESDPGADIPGWSVPVTGISVPVAGHPDLNVINQSGWARIHIDDTTPNGAIEFVLANPDRHIHYDNNGCVGDTVADQYPMDNETSVTIREARLVKGFTFHGWTTNPDGTGTLYTPGQVVNLDEGITTLYAKATYTGTIHVALSFKKADGKRYFLTHPGTATPRFSHARRIDDWTDAYQGMANADNVDNRYINTFKVLTHPDPCAECAVNEVVLDPRREMRYGAIDSLEFYEHFAPGDEEYLGLYYTDPNTVLANTTWAGLFKSTGATGRNGWPDYTVADVKNAKLSSTHYLHRVAGVITRDERSNKSAPWIAYNAADNQFDGVANEANATVFQISRVRVADEHYVVVPDTTDAWNDEIVFGFHEGEQTVKDVWSKLIGKQLMAVTKLDDQIVYFHPNDAKTLTNADQLRLSQNYRLEQTFEYIRDARVESHTSVDDEDKPHMSDKANAFGKTITSGVNSPVNVIYNGEYIDIVDTLRITLRTLGINKIKDYYGRWRDGAPGLHIRPDGSRYRDIIIRTKTTHYSDEIVRMVITPEYPMYNFYPLAGASKRLTFTMRKVTLRQLLDTEGNLLREEVVHSESATSSLQLTSANCSFSSGGAHFAVDAPNTLGDHITLVTRADNSSGINYDTLIINSTARVSGVDYPVTGRVPLMQSALSSSELIWSVTAGGKRYYIMAKNNGLIFRQFALKNGVLYKKEDEKTQLVKGSYDAANSRTEYITPWRYTYVNQAEQQLSLTTDAPVSRDFVIDGSTPTVASSGAATLTYEYVHEYINDNANFEEQVKLKYGADKWLKFSVSDGGTPSLTLTSNYAQASVFSWTYLQQEYYMCEHTAYPSTDQLIFSHNSTSSQTVQTRYKAYRIYSMMLDSIVTYCGRVDENDIADLISAGADWLTQYNIDIIRDSRFSAGASGLSKSTNTTTLTTTVTPAGDSPMEIRYPAETGPFVNIVDTLDVVISLQKDAPSYRFTSKWSSFRSLEDAHLKIPLIRETFHAVPHDSVICTVDRDEYEYVFPADITADVNDTHTFSLRTDHRVGTSILDVGNHVVDYTSSSHDHTANMDFTDPALTEIRLIDEYGNTPNWCEVSGKGAHTITVRCKQDGIRSPRSASLYIAYTMNLEGRWRYINFRLGVVQLSKFQYANNQVLIHSKGESGDSLVDGVQQVHENKNIIYYYNPSNAAQSKDQRVELPVRERNFYGWWRWYSMESGKEDTDIPAEKWQTAPSNTTTKPYKYPYRIIGDSVDDGAGGKKLVTQGRYTVFHNPSKEYDGRKDPPAKAPMVYPPQNKAIVKYALDKSVYYDNLPLTMKGQVDTAKLDTMQQIIEPTLSLREIYELHPWTESADTLQHYKYASAAPYAGQRYMEDHVVRAPLGTRLLLKTEQRYNYNNLKGKHSESMLGYYLRDDNWGDPSWTAARRDTMHWCVGWTDDGVDCNWYTYNKSTGVYTKSNYKVLEANDFLEVKAKNSIPSGKDADTVIYCLRACSKATTGEPGTESEETVNGDSVYNICRYTIIYHRTNKYGPLKEENGAALITDDEIVNNFEVLERLNFDYNKPGTDYRVYPHPLPWADASYGYGYPKTALLPDNRPHNKDGLTNLANMGEYTLINRIPSFGTYWHKMEQHGGAANGYMIFCDGMSSAGQVAAISLHKKLCEGQKMYFSGYVGNPGNESGKTCPNFIFSVQGKQERVGAEWEDITSYMTGDLPQSDKWYQIYFPIEQKNNYEHFRVRVYNMAANDDGNDFIIDDMCIFATKPPLIAYQANTTCMREGETDNISHIVLRVDYKGFHDKGYNDHDVYYTVEQVEDGEETIFVAPIDGFINADSRPAVLPATRDTVFGVVRMPAKDYDPSSDLVFDNVGNLVDRFEASLKAGGAPFRIGYIYENLDNELRPVMYIIHKAEMYPRNHYRVRMSLEYKELTSSICAMTSNLKISNRMMLALNNEEQTEKEIEGMCANTTYDVSLRVRGSLLQDHAAPADINGSCFNDWLLHGETDDEHGKAEDLYDYTYSDIEKVIKDILRCDPKLARHNTNQFARNLSEVSRSEMGYVKTSENVTLTTSDHPYDVLAHLVNGGFLTLYHSNLLVTTASGDSIQYMIFPIVGTGSDAMLDMEVDVCPTPVFIKLKPTKGGDIPMTLGGFNPNAEPTVEPPVILMTKAAANTSITIPIDSIMHLVALDSIVFLSTNDPNYLEGVHKLHLLPDREYDFSSGSDNSGYYKTGDNLILRPAADNNYQMCGGYKYTFGITMQTITGSPTLPNSDCRVGTVPFTIAVLPSAVQWNPKADGNASWNSPNNWIGITQPDHPIHSDAHFAPTRVTNVIIPAMEDGLPYPVIPSSISREDSVKQTGFEYNRCNAIRFLPGGAMGQQQNLNFSKAVIDLPTPHEQWALRSAPITGMLSGDIFMAEADLNEVSSPWEVGNFDANGRNKSTGNASFWLSLYSKESIHKGNGDDIKNDTVAADTEWARVTNAMTLSLPPASGWAVFTRTKSRKDAAIRLPKKDDTYYYFDQYGNTLYDIYENNLQYIRDTCAGGAGKAGKLAFDPDGDSQSYTLTNGAESSMFVFGNPTMGYIDIWGFIADNGLSEAFDYIDSEGKYVTTNKAAAESKTTDVISEPQRYLPPMHAIVIKTAAATTSKAVTLNTNRVVTSESQIVRAAPARRTNASGRRQGIMTVTAINPLTSTCKSRLLIGQGYHNALRDGEDAILTTVNIKEYDSSAPSTLFNIYAQEGEYGLCIDLRDEVLNIPVSFYMMKEVPFEPVTQLWFTGVNSIDGELVFYDALTGSEQKILDGMCIKIPTPEQSHETRYYIRRRGYDPNDPGSSITTSIDQSSHFEMDGASAVKIIHNGHVFILRDGHVYTMFGQKLR